MGFGRKDISILNEVVTKKQVYIFYGIIFSVFIGIFIWAMTLTPDPNGFFSIYKKEYRGIVTKVESGMSGSILATFKDRHRFGIQSSYISDTIKEDQLKLKEWEQKSIIYFLQPGDSVFKTKNSDTVFVYRNNITYTFIDRYVD